MVSSIEERKQNPISFPTPTKIPGIFRLDDGYRIPSKERSHIPLFWKRKKKGKNRLKSALGKGYVSSQERTFPFHFPFRDLSEASFFVVLFFFRCDFFSVRQLAFL